MDAKDGLLKSIWYAFAALEHDKCGRVSKSQLKVLSHSLHTVLNIPVDPKILDDHFRDDDRSPISTRGYMPYLKSYILDKVREGTFDRSRLEEVCWMLAAKKHYLKDVRRTVPEKDAFRLWCMFNFLSEDTFPPVMVSEEVRFLLNKLMDAMGLDWHKGEQEDFLSQKKLSPNKGVSVWQFLENMESERFFPRCSSGALSQAVDHVYQEIYLGVIKKGYLWKKGGSRRNWNNRWFVLKPPHLSYYTDEDMKDMKGEIVLNVDCVPLELPEKENRRYLFCVKTKDRVYEMRASETQQRQHWIAAIKTAIKLHAENKTSMHGEQKMKRRQQREKERKEKSENYSKAIEETRKLREELTGQMKQQSFEPQEALNSALEHQLAELDEEKRKSRSLTDDEAAKLQNIKIRLMEEMTEKFKMDLDAANRARQEEEAVREAQAKILKEEEEQLIALVCLKDEQNRLIQKTQEEKEELHQEILAKNQALEQANFELSLLQKARKMNHQNLEEAQNKLNQAKQDVKKWHVDLHTPLLTTIQPGESARQWNQGVLSHRKDGIFLEKKLTKQPSETGCPP